MSPYHATTLLKYGNPNNLTPPKFSVIIVTGGKISNESASALGKIFLNPVAVMTGYAQTELYSAVILPTIEIYIKNLNLWVPL